MLKTMHNKLCRTSTNALVIIAIAFALGNAGIAHADGHKRSRAEAVEIAKQRSGGSGDSRVLSVKKRTNDKGVTVFAVKIITNGRVKVYTVQELK